MEAAPLHKTDLFKLLLQAYYHSQGHSHQVYSHSGILLPQ